MATIKKASKAKNISAGPSKKTPIAPKVDPQGQYTKVQERTLGNMKKGGKLKKAQGGDSLSIKSAQKENTKKILDQISQKQLKSKPTMRPLKKGGKVKNWIQGAVNPKHKGYCTPMTKKTCTPKRKALAMTFKKMAKARKGK